MSLSLHLFANWTTGPTDGYPSGVSPNGPALLQGTLNTSNLPNDIDTGDPAIIIRLSDLLAAISIAGLSNQQMAVQIEYANRLVSGVCVMQKRAVLATNWENCAGSGGSCP